MSTQKSQLPKSRAKTAYDLLSEVCALIKAEPLRYNQTWWLSRTGLPSQMDPPKGYPSCGTVGCVAGWVTTLKRLDVGHREWTAEGAATETLGLDDTQADELFAADAVSGKPQTKAHVASGIRHIRRFQKTYAAQLKAKKV